MTNHTGWKVARCSTPLEASRGITRIWDSIYIAPVLPHSSHAFLFCSWMESFAECLVVNCNGILLPSGIIGLYLKNRYAAVLVIGRRLDWRSRRSISIVNLENKKSIAKNVENVERALRLWQEMIIFTEQTNFIEKKSLKWQRIAIIGNSWRRYTRRLRIFFYNYFFT